MGRENLPAPLFPAMPLNESKRKTRRERWPLEFDLEGVPRDVATRKQLLETTKEQLMPQNRFAGESRVAGLSQALSPAEKAALLDELLATVPVGREIDLGKPVIVPYRVGDPRNNYPKMVYHHDSGHVMTIAAGPDAEKQLKAAQKRGFEEKPSPNHDYSQIRNGRAAVKATAPAREEQMSAEELADLDSQDAAS